MVENNKLLVTLVAAVFVLMVGSTSMASPAFANHQSEDLRWQLQVISSAPACTNSHYYMIQKYTEIVDSYIDMYKIENSMHEPECYTVHKYEQYQAPSDLDLIVLVYDRDLGRAQLHSQNMGGYYAHDGADITTNHAVVFCGDCSNFYYSDPVWILTHELSHFALTYYGYNQSIIERLVHVNDKQYDECRENNLDSCEGFVDRISSVIFSNSYSVMPVYTPALIQDEDERTIELDEVQSVVIDLTKVVTQWWVQGKITDSDYEQVLGLDYANYNSDGEFRILFADESTKNEISWEDLSEKPAQEEQLDLISNIFVKDEKAAARVSEAPSGVKYMSSLWVNEEITDEEFRIYLQSAKNYGLIEESESNGLVQLILANEMHQNAVVQTSTKTIVNTEQTSQADLPATVNPIEKWYEEFKDMSRAALYALYDSLYEELAGHHSNADSRPKLDAVYRLLTE